jgi:hypothetical protein
MRKIVIVIVAAAAEWPRANAGVQTELVDVLAKQAFR